MNCNPLPENPPPKLIAVAPPLCDTINATVSVCVIPAPLAVIVSVNTPVGVDALVATLSVDEPDLVIVVGLNEAVAPVGSPLTLSDTVPLKLLVAATCVV